MTRAFLVALAALFGAVAAPGHAVAATPTRVLIVVMDRPEPPDAPDYAGTMMQALVEHFDATVVRVSAEHYESSQLKSADRLIVIGVDPSITPPPAFITDVSRFDVETLWAGYGIDQLPVDIEERFGVAVGYAESHGAPSGVEYRGRAYEADVPIFHLASASGNAEVVANYQTVRGAIPYIVQSGRLWFVNGVPMPRGDYPVAEDGPFLVFADALHEFMGQQHDHRLRSVLRLEDVSAHIDPERLRAVVEYLASVGVPYVLAVIPAQRMADGSLLKLEDRPDFVAVLRWAQEHGGTIAMHGYHHTFGSGEDYEFWDAERNAPPLGETWDLYAGRVTDGIRILRGLGLRPQLWETPHYAASPLGYQVFDHYFGLAIEDRPPVSWVPYITGGPDHELIPETIGYIQPGAAPGSGHSVQDQLERARLLKIVRDPWAVGFYHPVDVPLSELKALVKGLRELGYQFVDVQALQPAVRADYEPGWAEAIGNALGVDRELFMLHLRDWALARFSWWGAITALPWGTVLLLGFSALLILRLRSQWTVLDSAADTVLAGTVPRRRSFSLSVAVAAGFITVAVVSVALSLASAQPVTATGRSLPLGDPLVSLPGRATPAGAPVPPGDFTSRGWEISTYFTVVEDFHAGPTVTVTGCESLECSAGTQVLGSFRSSFVDAVVAEGSGRTSQPDAAGHRYLNWSASTGYWLDFYPRDARGFVLRPYHSVAAGSDLAFSQGVEIVGCGLDKVEKIPIAPDVCTALVGTAWSVRDRFEEDPGPRRLDLYIGEERGRGFAGESREVIHTIDAIVRLAGGRSG